MLIGRGFLAVVTERRDTVDVMVDEDMALVGRDDPVPPGVTSPDRKPGRNKRAVIRLLFRNDQWSEMKMSEFQCECEYL